MFKTKLERETEYNKYKPEIIKYTAIKDMQMLPEDGEMFSFRGGVGNKILKQLKNENGILYKRDSSYDEWQVEDMEKLFNRMFSFLQCNVMDSLHQEAIGKKWYEFWKS